MLDTKQSWRHLLGSESCFTAVQTESATPPHVQVMSLHMISTRPSPVLVLQVTNAGVRRPGYEATIIILIYFEILE